MGTVRQATISQIVIGVDIGQRVDPTAIAVVQEEMRGKHEHYLVRYLSRLPLGTPYPGVVDRLKEVTISVKEITRKELMSRRTYFDGADLEGLGRGLNARMTMFVDATGVGQPVMDLLKGAGVKATAVYFTHGDRRTKDEAGVKLGKAWLVSRLQALLQTERIHLPDTPEAKVLAKELLDYEIRLEENANDKYGAFKVGTHDDLVTALGLAVQGEKPKLTYWF